MKIPIGINITEGAREDFVLKMIRNIYGQKQAGQVWNKYLHRILSKLGFVQSQVDECVYYRDGVIYLLYTDDSIPASRSEAKIRQAIIDIERSGLKITIEGSIADFLGSTSKHWRMARSKCPNRNLQDKYVTTSASAKVPKPNSSQQHHQEY